MFALAFFLLKLIFPHHAFKRSIGALIVFGARLAVVHIFDRSFHFKINQLADGHACIDTHRFDTGYLECPCVAITDVSFSSCSMNINAETTDT